MAERFIGEEDFRLYRKGARDCHALTHATRQFVRISIGKLTEAEPVQPCQAALALLGFRHADEFEGQSCIVEGRPPGQQPVLLEDGRDAPAELIELADTVSEVRMVKHAYDKGIKARRGIEY